MILQAVSTVYGAAAMWRRQWYARDMSRQRVLSQPVISVGNLSVGGSGKTPIVEAIARLIAGNGGRPAILTRGYGRRASADGVTVVSDGSTILENVETAGDEPLMLARHLPGIPVLVGADRYLSGRFAERRLACDIHLLDDGFQHLQLARDINLLAIDEPDLAERVIPAGRLREPLEGASAADALLAINGSSAVERFGRELGITAIFHVVRKLGTPYWIGGLSDPIPAPVDAPLMAVAAIARPQRFFDDLANAGWRIADAMTFRDHHWFAAADLAQIARRARDVGSNVVLTTEKDAIRLEGLDRGALRFAAVPLTIGIEPAGAFQAWLFARLARRIPHQIQ